MYVYVLFAMGGKSNKQSKVARQPDAAADAEPSMSEAKSELGAAAKQLIILPVMWVSGKIDFTVPDNVQMLRIWFCVVCMIGYVALQLGIRRCKSKNDATRVPEPGESMYLASEDKAADGSVSARTYDNAKLQEAKMQFVMSAAISCFVHFNWHYTQPLILMSIMQPMQLFDNPAVGIHVRGKSGPGYERPFKSQNAGNPLAQWAEKKKAEAQAAKKKD